MRNKHFLELQQLTSISLPKTTRDTSATKNSEVLRFRPAIKVGQVLKSQVSPRCHPFYQSWEFSRTPLRVCRIKRDRMDHSGALYFLGYLSCTLYRTSSKVLDPNTTLLCLGTGLYPISTCLTYCSICIPHHYASGK